MDKEARTRIFDESSALGLLVKLSVPTVITTMIMLVYNLADIFFIGQTHDGLQDALWQRRLHPMLYPAGREKI